MNNRAGLRRGALALCLVVATFGVTACGGATGSNSAQKTEESTVATPTTPAFHPDNVAPITAPAVPEPVDDPGLHVTWQLQATSIGLSGGSIITVLVRNNNEMPLPIDAIAAPTLRLSDGTVVDRIDAATAGIAGQDTLDYPLGAHASTNLRFAFSVSPGNLANAVFEIGNVHFEGNLNVQASTRATAGATQ